MDGSSGATTNAPDPDRASGFVVDRVRFRDIATVATIQRQSFRSGLAYGYFQLLVLLLLPNIMFLVARSPVGVVVGCVLADRYRRDLRIVNLAVDPGYRRQGVARLLLEEAQRVMPEGHVTLVVEEFNEAAKSLYVREGFHEVGFARSYYGRGRNGIWMRKDRLSGTATDKILV